MTKHRAPTSFEAALARIAGQLPNGYEDMARVAERSKAQCYAWGNPDMDDEVPLGRALALDLAYQAAGGDGAPIYEAYTVQLELAQADRFAGNIALARLIPDLMRENAEAEIALFGAAQPGATDAHRRLTRKEVEDAIMHWQRVLATLPSSEPENARSTAPP